MCWPVLAAVVLAIDVHAVITRRATLSSAFRDASRTHPVVVSVATVYLLAHLYGAVPASYDPLCRLTNRRGDIS